MKSRAAKKPAADEDEARSKKIRFSRGKHRRHRSRSSGSDCPPRKRSKKPTKKIADRKGKRSKGCSASGRRRHRHHRHRSPSPSSGSSSLSRGRSRHDGSSVSERSVSPLPRSRSGDTRKRKGRGRDREEDRKKTRTRRSRSYSSSASDSSWSRSRNKGKKLRSGGVGDDASRDDIVQDYDDYRAYQTEKNSAEDVGKDEEADALSKKGTIGVDEYEKNVGLEKMESPPYEDSNEAGEILPFKDANESDDILPSNEAGEILPLKDANESDDILPAGSGSPEAEEDLELILRQKALENFRKFRGAAVRASKADISGSGKEGVLSDSRQDTVTKTAEARSAVTPFQRQGSSIKVSHSAGSPGLEDRENGTSPWKQEENSRGDRSPGALLSSDTSTPSQQQGSRVDAIRSTSYITSQGRRNGGSVMQRLGNTPGSSASVKQRLGSSAGVSATPRVRSVVSIPAREGFDGSTFTMSPTVCEDPAPVESSSEVRHLSVEINKLEGTNEDDRKTSQASAPESSVLSTDKGRDQTGTEDKDGSQFEKRTFSRMHDGETVQVSYKVYIPTKSPRLARKLQR